MKADRLISILMLLQSHGTMTAQELSNELEVSLRTIYRDMNALCIAGIPFESESGPGGGYLLEKGYRSNLHGLKDEELQAILTLKLPTSILPPPLAQKLKSALMKLQSKSSTLTTNVNLHFARCFIDGSNWSLTEWNDPIIRQIYHAVCHQTEIILCYKAPELGGMEFSRQAQPYGLFLYKDNWVLLYKSNGKVQGRSCRNIVGLKNTLQLFSVPKSKNIEILYKQWKNKYNPPEKNFKVRLITPEKWKDHLVEYLEKELVPRLATPIDYKKTTWVEMEVKFHTMEEARKKILILGGMVKVIEPLSLQYNIRDFAMEILNRCAKTKLD